MTIRTEQADLDTWQWPVEAFDVVVAIFFQFCAPPLRTRVFANIKRALKPGGLLLMEGYSPSNVSTKPAGLRRSRISTRASCWKNRFRISPRSRSRSTTAKSTKAPDMAACPR